MKLTILQRLKRDRDDLDATIRTLTRYGQQDATRTIGGTVEKAAAMFEASRTKTRKAGRKPQAGPKAGKILTARINMAKKPLSLKDLAVALKDSAWTGNKIYAQQAVNATVRNGLKAGIYKQTAQGIVKAGK